MNLAYSLKSGGVGSVHVKFDPPLAGYEEVKPRLLAMKADAQEALGMVRGYPSFLPIWPFTRLVVFLVEYQLQSPKIMTFRLPPRATIALYVSLATAYIAWAPPRGTTLQFMPANITDMVFTPAHTILRVIGFQPSMTRFIQLAAVVHGFECLYTWYLCRRYVKGPLVKVSERKYVSLSPC